MVELNILEYSSMFLYIRILFREGGCRQENKQYKFRLKLFVGLIGFVFIINCLTEVVKKNSYYVYIKVMDDINVG